jgi:hypothetical protein
MMIVPLIPAEQLELTMRQDCMTQPVYVYVVVLYDRLDERLYTGYIQYIFIYIYTVWHTPQVHKYAVRTVEREIKRAVSCDVICWGSMPIYCT